MTGEEEPRWKSREVRSFGLVLMPATSWDERAILDVHTSFLLFKKSGIEELEDVINSGEERTRN